MGPKKRTSASQASSSTAGLSLVSHSSTKKIYVWGDSSSETGKQRIQQCLSRFQHANSLIKIPNILEYDLETVPSRILEKLPQSEEFHLHKHQMDSSDESTMVTIPAMLASERRWAFQDKKVKHIVLVSNVTMERPAIQESETCTRFVSVEEARLKNMTYGVMYSMFIMHTWWISQDPETMNDDEIWALISNGADSAKPSGGATSTSARPKRVHMDMNEILSTISSSFSKLSGREDIKRNMDLQDRAKVEYIMQNLNQWNRKRLKEWQDALHNNTTFIYDQEKEQFPYLVRIEIIPRQPILQKPLMIGSQPCHTRHQTFPNMECAVNGSGQFVVQGKDRVITHRTRMPYNQLFIVNGQWEKKKSVTEYIECKSSHPGKTRTTSNLIFHMQRSQRNAAMKKGLAFQLPYVDEAIPMLCMFRAYGFTDDNVYAAIKFTYDHYWSGKLGPGPLEALMRLVRESVESDTEDFPTQRSAELFIGANATTSYTENQVESGRNAHRPGFQYHHAASQGRRTEETDLKVSYVTINQEVLPRIGGNESAHFRKGMFIALMVVKFLLYKLGHIQAQDRDDTAAKSAMQNGELQSQFIYHEKWNFMRQFHQQFIHQVQKNQTVNLRTLLDHRSFTKYVNKAFASGDFTPRNQPAGGGAGGKKQKAQNLKTGISVIRVTNNLNSIMSQSTEIVGAYIAGGQKAHVRGIHNQWGAICPFQTKEGRSCLASDSRVALANGFSRPISEVYAGTQVITYDIELGGYSNAPTSDLLDQGVKECVELLFSDGKVITCTPDHKFMLYSTFPQWVEAKDLKVSENGEEGSLISSGIEFPEMLIGGEDSVDEMKWELDLTFSLGYKLNLKERLEHTIAFCGILGYWFGCCVIFLRQMVNVQWVLRDIKTLTGQTAVTESNRDKSVVSVILPQRLNRAFWDVSLSFLKEDNCPRVAIQAFLSGLFGSNSSASISDIEFLLGRLGISKELLSYEDPLADKTRLLWNLSLLRNSDIGKKVGFRYDYEKQMWLSSMLAAVRLGTSNEDMPSIPGNVEVLPSLKVALVSRKHVGPRPTFDLTVPGTNNFLAETVCVHNCGIDTNKPVLTEISDTEDDRALVNHILQLPGVQPYSPEVLDRNFHLQNNASATAKSNGALEIEAAPLPAVTSSRKRNRETSVPRSKDANANFDADAQGITTLFVNGVPAALVEDGDVGAREMIQHLKSLRRKGHLSHQTQIVHWTPVNGMRAIDVKTDGGRFCSPARLVLDRLPELLFSGRWLKMSRHEMLRGGYLEVMDKCEEENAIIAEDMWDLQKRLLNGQRPTHLEVAVVANLSWGASQIAFLNSNQSPRNTYQINMGNQSYGSPFQNILQLMFTSMNVMMYPQKPINANQITLAFQVENLSPTFNPMVMFGPLMDMNQEDGCVLNADAVDRGMARTISYRTISSEEKQVGSVHNVERFTKPDLPRTLMCKAGSYASIADDGIVELGAKVVAEDVLVSRTLNNVKRGPKKTEEEEFLSELGARRILESGQGTNRVSIAPDAAGLLLEDNSVCASIKDEGIVDQVMITNGVNDLRSTKIRVRQVQIPQIGDKFSSQHGQKQTVSFVLPSHHFPFNDRGEVPSIVINPHCIITRMTIGMLIEMLYGVILSQSGHRGNSTSFTDLWCEALEKCDQDIREAKMAKREKRFRLWKKLLGDKSPPPVPKSKDGETMSTAKKQKSNKGVWKEALKSASDALDEEEVDPDLDLSTLSPDQRIHLFAKVAKKLGLSAVGHQRMYHPVTGRPMGEGSKTGDGMMFMAICPYQRLLHNGAGKMQARATGPMNIITRQPTEGRANNGGYREGEMERDVIISHGAQNVLYDRFVEATDKIKNWCVCCVCGYEIPANSKLNIYTCRYCQTDQSARMIESTFAFKKLMHEMYSLGHVMRLETTDVMGQNPVRAQ